MNEETFNLQIRKFLKTVGVTSQREIEKAVRTALEENQLKGDEELPVHVSMSVPEIGLEIDIDGKIALE